MSAGAVSADRAWNTWDPVYPAEFVHRPSGMHVALCAYSDAAGSFTRFPPGGVRLGPRHLHGDSVELGLAHAGTELDIRFAKPDANTVRLSWRRIVNGEWGLRFWVLVCVWREDGAGGEGGGSWQYDEAQDTLSLDADGRHFALKGERPPLMATFHDSLAGLAGEMETNGYFFLDSRGESGKVGVFRYNLEEMPDFTLAISSAASGAAAIRAADEACLPADAVTTPPVLQTGRYDGALDAIRDVIGWNTVWDSANRRGYTALSRNWVAQKFGGWGVWLDDVLYHGLMAGLLDGEVARENLAAVFAGATPAGNLPCLLTGRDSWVDRSQPPIGAFVVRMLHLRSHDRSLLEMSYDVLRANHEWWWRERDGNGNGLLEYGTSPVGSGLYRGTALAARNESMMDNSPVHEQARLDPDSHTLDCEDVALNSLLALDGECLAEMAAELGREGEAAMLRDRTEALKGRIRAQLWDERRGVFANRLWSGDFVDALAPTSFFPLICGAASDEQAAALVERHLLNPDEFWGEAVLPSVARNHPAFGENVYWRGRIWPPLNFIVYYGLRRYGYDAVAADVAGRSHVLFMREWRDHRRCAENYNGATGAAADQPDTDLFYSWGALLATLGVADLMDVNPWEGWAFENPATGSHSLGPVLTPAGPVRLEISGGAASLSAAGRSLLRTTAPGRFRHLTLAADAVSMEVPAGPGGRLVLPALRYDPAGAASLGGRTVTVAAEDGCVALDLPESDRRLPLSLGPSN